jgi:hypothetical protein
MTKESELIDLEIEKNKNYLNDGYSMLSNSLAFLLPVAAIFLVIYTYIQMPLWLLILAMATLIGIILLSMKDILNSITKYKKELDNLYNQKENLITNNTRRRKNRKR